MKTGPWAARFRGAWSDADLDQMIEIHAVPIQLGKDTPDCDADALRIALKRVFLSGKQVRKLLRQLVGVARSHAEAYFSSVDAHGEGLYKSFPWGGTTLPAICFAGLAGVGKSELFAALLRLLSPPTVLDVPGINGLPLVSAWPMTLRDGASLNALLRPHLKERKKTADADQEKTEKSIKEPLLLQLSRRRSWRDGVCLLWADEFQFISQGSGANAKATGLLLQLLGIGPRLVFVANFSLVHKLMRRNQEDRQRLVAQPMILEPEICSSPEWLALISEYKKVAPGVLTFDLYEGAKLIHKYTFGIKRLVVELLVGAYLLARRRGKNHPVGLDEIKQAYKMATVNREDVETLWRQAESGAMIKEDLWCPFDQFQDEEKVTTAQSAIDSFESRVEDELLDSALLPSEAAAVRTIEPNPETKQRRAKVLPMSRAKVTKQSMLDACASLDA